MVYAGLPRPLGRNLHSRSDRGGRGTLPGIVFFISTAAMRHLIWQSRTSPFGPPAGDPCTFLFAVSLSASPRRGRPVHLYCLSSLVPQCSARWLTTTSGNKIL